MSNETVKPTNTAVVDALKAAAPAVQAVSQDALEAAVNAALAKAAAKRKEDAKPKEPDWATLTEAEAMSAATYIPVIEHDIPDYMNMKLKDAEYMCVWASTDQRRIGQLQAEGYEFLKKEHIHPDFKVPLLFDSEGLYTYADVVCMRVHKRIVYGKRKKALQVSLNQLANRNRPPRVKQEGTFELTPGTTPEVGSFYETI
jgi:hypothetical protein